MYEKMIVVGILEESRKRNTFKLLREILIKLNFKISYKNHKGNIIILNNNDKNIMIIDIEPKNIDSINSIGLDFTILVHTFLRPDDYESLSLKSVLKHSKNIIVNCDEEKWTALLEENKESIVISYGFNNKATINPSSYNIHYSIKANICFQREIFTILGDKVEPFEIPIRIDSMQKQDLYSGMAVLASALILGVNNLIVEDLIEFKINL